MMRFLAGAMLCAALLGIGYSVGRATTSLIQDGDWWKSTVPEDAKVYVVQGALDAYTSGWNDGSIAAGSRIANEASDKSLALGRTIGAIVYRKTSDGTYVSFQLIPRFSRTFGYYQSAIQNFYVGRGDAASNTSIGSILACLPDHPVYTCDQVEKFATTR